MSSPLRGSARTASRKLTLVPLLLVGVLAVPAHASTVPCKGKANPPSTGTGKKIR